jgi:predicted flap endonuclease-1-like 5' DNA nuclease
MMNTDWVAILEPWWPMLAAAGAGVVFGWLLRGRRAHKPPEPAPEVISFRQGKDGAVQPKLGEPLPFPAHPPSDAARADAALAFTPEVARALPADLADELAPDLPAELTAKSAPEGEAAAPFEQFESKLREWQAHASIEAAVQPVHQAAIDEWDDLMDIDGVDLALVTFLYDEGIHTFDQIAAMTPLQLREVLDRAGPAYGEVDPATWPESARRAVLAR